MASWSWDDGGAGGSFSPSASEQNPSYNAPANTTDSDIIVTLTANATCDGPSPLGDSDSTPLTVLPVAHTFEVSAFADPETVPSAGTTSLTASYTDSRTHSATGWSWDDAGAGGTFVPSADMRNPGYTAPVNATGSDVLVTLTVSASCDGTDPLFDDDSVVLTVSPAVPTDTIGLFDPAKSRFYLRNSNTTGVADITVSFGPAGSGWLPITGDWNGDGTDTIGLFNPVLSKFYLRNSNTTGVADITVSFGRGGSGWTPVVGDWNGDGTDTIGLFDPAKSRFYLRNSNTTGVAEIAASFGPGGSGWLPLTGDWDGDGTDTIGLFNPVLSKFYLRNSNTTGVADITVSFGPGGSGWTPLTGDWDGS